MPTKSEIEARVNRIVQIFQKAMPRISTPYPSVTVATQRTYRDARAMLIARTGSEAISTPTDEWGVELISGAKGSAILIRKEEVKSLDHLYHALWSILGRFYMSDSAATPHSSSAAPQEDSLHDAKEFWAVFASEAIANRVERFLRANTPPAKVEWKGDEIKTLQDAIHVQIMRVYGQRNIEVTELAMLLATILTDDLLKEIVNTQPGKDDWLVKMPADMQPILRELIILLEEQLGKERFWEMDDGTLKQINTLLADLNREYQYLIAGELVEDEMAAAMVRNGDVDALDGEWPELPEIY